MYTLLRGKNDGLKDDALAFAQQLVQTPSQSLEEQKVAGMVEAQMRALGYDKVFQDDAGNVIGILNGREAAPTVLLNSHMDTVSPAEQSRWPEPPFSGRIAEGRLHGLGAADCKGGVAAQVFAGGLLKRSLLPLKGNLVVAATVAEENGCSVGVRTLMEQTLPELGLKPEFALLGEPTDLGLYYGHDGWLEMEIRVEGTNPFHVDDAAHAIFKEYAARPTGTPESFKVREPHFESPWGLRRATIQMDRRLRDAEDVRSILCETQRDAALAAYSSGSVAVAVEVREESQRLYNGRPMRVRRLVHAWQTDPFHPLMEHARQALSAADCAVRPARWNLHSIGMGTAGAVLTREFGVPTVGYGPGSEDVAHTANESVETAKLFEAIYGTAVMAHRLVGIPVFGWTSDEI